MTIPSIKIRIIVLDLLLFMFPSLVFNLFYTIEFQSGLDGGLLNIYLVFLTWIMVTSLRLVLAVFIPSNKIPFLNFILMAICWESLVLFYLLCYIGLTAWGRVPTITMIHVYLGQLNVLIDTLNIPGWMLILFIIIALATLVFLYKLVWNKTLWLSFIAHKLPRSLSLFTFTSLGSIGIILFWQNFYYSFYSKNEVQPRLTARPPQSAPPTAAPTGEHLGRKNKKGRASP